jgi:serine/threonine protein phosphatase PrpC
MGVGLNIGKCTLLGNYRENNEDALDVKQFADMTICVVADGMGGQQAGEIASKQAVEILPREIKSNLAGITNEDEIRLVIRRAMVHANAVIMDMASMDRDLTNMGTTVVLALWPKGSDRLYIANIGDSRAYQITASKIEQLTVDHSIAQALVETRTISPAEARVHKYRNVLWKYLGCKEVGDGPEVKVLTPHKGDRFLLCTDGLSGVVPDETLQSFVVENANPQHCADGLGQLALDSGSKDNVSCIVMEFTESR